MNFNRAINIYLYILNTCNTPPLLVPDPADHDNLSPGLTSVSPGSSSHCPCALVLFNKLSGAKKTCPHGPTLGLDRICSHFSRWQTTSNLPAYVHYCIVYALLGYDFLYLYIFILFLLLNIDGFFVDFWIMFQGWCLLTIALNWTVFSYMKRLTHGAWLGFVTAFYCTLQQQKVNTDNLWVLVFHMYCKQK